MGKALLEQLILSSFLEDSQADQQPVRPVLKWAGGKQQLVRALRSRFPTNHAKYIEPFFGGGALFFAQQPAIAVLADANAELMHFYGVVANRVEELIGAAKTLISNSNQYYEIRKVDPATLNDVERAARFLYLNRTCYNGLYRVNRKGEFNVPFGRYKNPSICDATALRRGSDLLQRATLVTGDYKHVLLTYAEPKDFIFLDPPYIPISKYSDFKRYTNRQFREQDHRDLANLAHELHERGCYVMLTNSNHPLVRELYQAFEIVVVPTKRYINSVGSNRMGEDVIITSYSGT
jgi:DNA adenine methylase